MTNGKVRRTHKSPFILLGLAVALVLSLVLSASAAPTLEKPRTFSLLEVDVTDSPLGDFGFDRAPIGGDQFTLTSRLYRWTGTKSRGARVGRDRVLVTFMSGFGTNFDHRATVLVQAQVYLPDGTLMIEGFGAIAPERPARFKLPVVGGTGVYDNARGYLSVRDIGNTGRTKLDFHLVP